MELLLLLGVGVSCTVIGWASCYYAMRRHPEKFAKINAEAKALAEKVEAKARDA